MNLRILCLALLAVLALSPIAQAQEEKAAAPLSKARELKDQGEYEKARTLLLAAIEKEPKNADLVLEVGKVNHLQARDILASNASLGRLALYDAKTWYEKALALKPEWPEALQLLGSVATELGDLKTAVSAWKRAAEQSPEIGECHYQLGYCLALLGRFDEAIKAFKEATKLLGPDPRILLNQGISHASLKQTSDAEACFSGLITGEIEADRRGGNFMNRGVLWLWRLHSDANRYPQAEEAFARLAVKHPEVSAIHWYIGHARLRQRNTRGAAVAFRKVTELLPSWADGWRQLGGALAKSGEYGAAEEALIEEAKLDPGGQAPQELLFEIVAALKNEGRAEEAIGLLKRVEPSFPDDSLVIEARGDLHFALGKLEAALADYRKASEIDEFADDPVIKAEKAATALLRAGKTAKEVSPGRLSAEEEAPGKGGAILDFDSSEVFVRAYGAVDGRRKDGRFSAKRTGTANDFANVALTFVPTMDTRPFTALRFDVKGPEGRKIVVRMKDCYDEFGMRVAFLRIQHHSPVALTGEWQTVSLPLTSFTSMNDNRPIHFNRARLRAITFQFGEAGGEAMKLAPEAQFDNVALVPERGEPLLLADFSRQPEETLFISEGAAEAFARTLFSVAQAEAFRPDANTYVTPAIFGEDFDKSFVQAGYGSFRLTLTKEGAAAGALSFNPDRSYDRATALYFWARGREGGEKVRVTFTDAMDQDLGNDAPAAAPRLMVSGRMMEGWFSLSPEWRKYRIPRSMFPDVNFDALLAIRFHMGTPEGNPIGTTVFLDSIGWE